MRPATGIPPGGPAGEPFGRIGPGSRRETGAGRPPGAGEGPADGGPETMFFSAAFNISSLRSIQSQMKKR